MSAPLVFEIGVEELPASFVTGALDALPGIARELLAHARLAHGAVYAHGTPRRLTLLVEELSDRQPDLSEKVLGPPRAAAFDESGAPKKAAEGFAKKLGLDVGQLFIEETDKGAYVAGVRQERGKSAAEVLPVLLAELGRRIPFPKSMRWGQGDVAFGRPVHWLLALHGERLVDVTFAGAAAGRETRGHRFLAPEAFAVPHASRYVDALRDAHVVVSVEERQRVMRERLEEAARAAGGELVPDAFLMGENASLVEEPYVITGSFDPVFLALPEEVIVGVMRGHQRYFALRDPSTGTLLPRYLAVVNTARAPEVIVRGNDRVLRARLADARFFVDTDRAHGLDARVPQLDQVVFQAKLGTVGERVRRLAQIVGALGDDGPAAAAARLAKADLVSLIVGELPELQGIMGRWYALREGIAEDVADAIRDHYLPRGAGDAVPTAVASARLAIADRADALVGCFGIGLVPSGSADPFALRRAALGIVRIALEGPLDVDVRATLRAAHAAYQGQGKPVADEATVLAALDEFFRARLASYFGERYPTDVVDACLGAWSGGSLRDLAARLEALEGFRRLPAYESLAVAFKRAFNIAKDAPEGAPDPAIMTEEAERALAERFATIAPALRASVERAEYAGALALVAEQLREPIDRFFEQVFVMDPDAAVRDNRLRLLGSIARTLTAIAHFHRLGAQPSAS
jgi:glycyl-tRNA synthetase beta chain